MVKIAQNKVSGLLLFAGGLLLLANLASLVFKYGYNHRHLLGFARLFYFDTRGSLSHYFISILLLTSSLLLYLIAMSHKSEGGRHWIHWSILSFVFLSMSLDKLLRVREIPIHMFWKAFAKTGLSYPIWIFFKVTLFMLFVTVFLRFFLRLPSRVRLLVFVAAFLFVAGGIGVDNLSSYLHFNKNISDLSYSVMSTVEESMEMLGIIVFIHALLGYLAEYAPRKAFIITNLELI